MHSFALASILLLIQFVCYAIKGKIIESENDSIAIHCSQRLEAI